MLFKLPISSIHDGVNFPITQREIEQISASQQQQQHTDDVDDISNDRTTLAHKSERRTKSFFKSVDNDNQYRQHRGRAATTGCISNSNTSGDTQRIDKDNDDDDCGAVTNERYKSQYETIVGDKEKGGGCQRKTYTRNRRIEKVGSASEGGGGGGKEKPAASSSTSNSTWCSTPGKYCQR